LDIILVTVACAVLFGLVPVIKAHLDGPKHFTACRLNLMRIGTALEMYCVDNCNRYPTTLNQLVPRYLSAIPTCPAADADTYSSGFSSAGFASASVSDCYTVVCRGYHHYHVGEARNFPQYRSTWVVDEM